MLSMCKLIIKLTIIPISDLILTKIYYTCFRLHSDLKSVILQFFFIIPEVRNFGVSLILNALSRYPTLELLNLKIND